MEELAAHKLSQRWWVPPNVCIQSPTQAAHLPSTKGDLSHQSQTKLFKLDANYHIPIATIKDVPCVEGCLNQLAQAPCRRCSTKLEESAPATFKG